MGSDSESSDVSLKIKQIDVLKRQRSAFKGQLIQFKNKLSGLNTSGEIESNIRRLQLMYDKYHRVQLKSEIQDDTASTDRVAFEEDYEHVESTLLNKLHALNKIENQPKEVIVFETSANSTQVEQSSSSMSIKLPELKLPLFNGAETEWLAFRDVFRDLIHSKPQIDSTVKFVYLLSHIRAGKAFSLIENLPVTSDNYEVAWKILCDRYNNTVSIQKVHMQALYDVKSPQENSSNALQAIIDHSVKNYNALKSLNTPVDSWDLILIHHLTEKLDATSKIHIIKNSETTKLLTFGHFIDNLRKRVRILEAIKGTSTSKHTAVRKGFNYSKDKSTSLFSNSCKCPYCGGTHLLPHCTEFSDTKLTPKMRFQFTRSHGFCTNCLISQHKVGTCDKAPCGLCSLKHHRLLHFGTTSNFQVNKHVPTNSGHSVAQASRDINSSNRNNQTESNIIQTAGLSSCKCTQKSDNQSSWSNNVEQILIGTALINVNTSSNENLLCRALLDSGSQLNFVTESLVRLLRVRKQSTQKVISGIGGNETVIKTKVSLTISSRVSNFSETMDFYIIPRITNLLPANPVSFDLKAISAEIKLADPYFRSLFGLASVK